MADSHELRDLSDRQRQLSLEIRDSLHIYADLAAKFEELKGEDKVKKLESFTIQDIRLSEALMLQVGVMDSVLNMKSADSTAQDAIFLFRKSLDKELGKRDLTSFKSDEMYIEFQRSVWAVSHPNTPMPVEYSEDIHMMLPMSCDRICPISRQELSVPMKNKLCSHVFSKASIMSYLRSGKTVCPVAGCNAHISSKTLTFDQVKEQNLKKVNGAKQEESITDL